VDKKCEQKNVRSTLSLFRRGARGVFRNCLKLFCFAKSVISSAKFVSSSFCVIPQMSAYVGFNEISSRLFRSEKIATFENFVTPVMKDFFKYSSHDFITPKNDFNAFPLVISAHPL
jgi:hypothetical protein